MKNEATKPVFSRPFSRPFLGLMAFCMVGTLHANDLKDLVITGGKIPALKLIFAEGKKAEDFPLYFQKPDAGGNSITICFLETQTALPLGRISLPENSPIPALALKKVVTPSGKNFLGVEIVFSETPSSELLLTPGPGSSLRIRLTGKSQGKFQWMASGEAATSPTSAADKPKAADPDKAETAVVIPSPGPAAPDDRMDGAEKTETKPEAAVPPRKGFISDLEILIGTEQQDLVVVGENLGEGFSIQRDAKDSLAYLLRIPGAKIIMANKSPTPPPSSLISTLKMRQFKDTVLIQLRLRRYAPPQAGLADGKIIVTLPEAGGSGMKWTAAEGKIFASSGMAESGPSAHALGESVDQGEAKLSSSRVFLPAGDGKPMVLLRDSAALKADPKPKAKANKTLPAGARIQKIDKEGQWLKVVSETDTGFIKTTDAVYADEMTAAQEAKVLALMAAQEKAREAARLREEALARKQAGEDSARLANTQAEAPVVAQAAPASESLTVAAPIPAAAATTPSPTPAAPEPALVVAKAPEAAPAQLHIASNDEQKLSEIPDAAMRERLEQERLTAEKDKAKTAADTRVNYNSYGRRDPFVPVEEGNADNGIDIDQMKVVGVVWHPSDPMAVLQHVKENSVSFTIKQGDPVHNGRVSRITRDAVTFDITEYGISRSYTLKLVSMQERAKK